MTYSRTGLLLIGLLAPALRAVEVTPPSFLVLLADDHGVHDCSVYGATDIPTPHLARLAADGLTFDRAYVASPSCAPSRGALLTGLMPARNGAEANHTYPRPGVPILTHVLQSLGYEVAAFGKVAHGSFVQHCGFDRADRQATCKALERKVGTYLRGRSSERPLCLFVGASNPHVPWPAQTRFDPGDVVLPPTHIDTPETRQHRARYYEEIAELDTLVGRLRALAADYLGHNVLVLYSSDHGAQWPFAKWNLYEAGVRTPLLVAWPGVVHAGTRTQALVSWVDLLPTLIEIAGGTVPAGLDGRSFAGILRGAATAHREFIITTHSGDGTMNVYPMRAIRQGPWKFILNLHPDYAHTNHSDLLQKDGAGAYWPSWVARAAADPRAAAVLQRYYRRPAAELYDLSADPWEQHNLAEVPAHAAVRRALRGRLEVWMQQQGDTGRVFNEPRPLARPETWKPGRVHEAGR